MDDSSLRLAHDNPRVGAAWSPWRLAVFGGLVGGLIACGSLLAAGLALSGTAGDNGRSTPTAAAESEATDQPEAIGPASVASPDESASGSDPDRNGGPANATAEPTLTAGRAGGGLETDAAFARRLSSAFNTAASRVEPAVVHITTQAIVEGVRRGPLGLFPRRGESRAVPAGLGSGVIIDAEEGLIVTNNHVIAEGDRFVARLFDGREFAAEPVGSDPATDIAVLRIDADSITAAPFGDSDALDVGEWVLAIGSPFGFSSSVTAGIVSAKGRSQVGGPREASGYQEFIQTDASINPGNSGGPLIDLEGNIVGINTAIASRGGGSNGIGFAIPSTVVRGVVDLIREYGRVERGWLGVSLSPLEPDRARELGLGPSKGVRIAGVIDRTPAAEAGLRSGDVLLAINGREIEGLGRDAINRTRNLISLTPPGEPISLEVIRDGQRRSLRAELVDATTGLLRSVAADVGGRALYDLGVVVVEMSPGLSRRMRYLREVDGELVVYVANGSPASRVGLREEDILLDRRVLERDGRRVARLEVLRGSDRGSVEVPLLDTPPRGR